MFVTICGEKRNLNLTLILFAYMLLILLARLSEFLIMTGVSYLIGSINFAIIMGRLFRKNILRIGSRNPGALNSFKSIGWKTGSIVFIGDFFKPSVAFMIVKLVVDTVLPVVCIFVLIGHCWSIYNKFIGGKGISTFMGSIFLINSELLVGGIIVSAIAYFWIRDINTLVTLMGWMFLLFTSVFYFHLSTSARREEWQTDQFFFFFFLPGSLIILLRFKEFWSNWWKGK